jgi:subtilisin family serine protease
MWSIDQIQVPPLWRLGLTGERVRVGIIGSGIDFSHPDFRNNSLNAFSVVGSDVRDQIGHETGVTWITSRIAPRADMIVAKAMSTKFCGMEHMIDCCERLRQMNVDIVNISMAVEGSSDGTDPISAEVNYLAENGVAVVVAAGNKGPRFQTIGTPGAAERAITVGKSNQRDYVAWDSSRGPTSDGRIKPDLVAPGTRIIAAVPLPLRQGNYMEFECTSFAAPHVTGALALLKQAYPAASAWQLKDALMRSCDPAKATLLALPVESESLSKRLARKMRSAFLQRSDARWSTGAGRLNALRSYEWLKKVE